MSESYGVNLLTGATGCGKSTLAKIACDDLASKFKWSHPRIAWRDTSKCLDESKKRKTNAGLMLIEQNADQLAGKILSPKPVFESVTENISWIPGSMGLETFNLAGSPRTPNEAELFLNAFGKRRLRVFHIISTPEQVYAAIVRRIESGELREDDGPRTFQTKMAEYDNKVVPAIKHIPRDILTEIKYEMPLFEKVELFVKKMVIPDNIRKRMLTRLHTRNHPVRQTINGIVNARPQQAAVHPVRTFFHPLGNMSTSVQA
jgi:adenylate kinase family enzyme